MNVPKIISFITTLKQHMKHKNINHYKLKHKRNTEYVHAQVPDF